MIGVIRPGPVEAYGSEEATNQRKGVTKELDVSTTDIDQAAQDATKGIS